MTSSKKHLFRLCVSAMFLAMALALPFLTGQIPEVGNALCPMHLPVLLCGFFCGPMYGCVVGVVAPLLRFIFFGMPPLIPTGLAMCFELATYGFVAGFAYLKLPKKKWTVMVALLISMLAGRVVWGMVRYVFMGLGLKTFGMAMFIAEGFVNAIPGIILQIVLIPIIVISLSKYAYRGKKNL